MEKKVLQGLTNQISIKNNLLIKKSHQYVDLFLDRNNEIRIYQQLNELNLNWCIIPKQWNYVDNFNSVTDYYHEAITLADTNICATKMKTIIKLIEQIHCLRLVDIKVFDAKQFLNWFQTHIKTLPEEMAVYQNKLNLIVSNYWNDDTKPVFSHNDLVLGNFINYKKGWKVIDFEYAMYNHYLFDYASFISESLPFAKWEKFIKMLQLNQFQLTKLKELIFYQNCLWAYWATYMFEQTNQDIFKTIYQVKVASLNHKF